VYEYETFTILGLFSRRINELAGEGWEPVCKIGGIWPGYTVMLFKRDVRPSALALFKQAEAEAGE